jgi:hypothetical protein
MSRPKAPVVLLILAAVLALIGTAGGAAMLVHGRLTAEHVFDKARALAEQRWHHDNAMEAVREQGRAVETAVEPRITAPELRKIRKSAARIASRHRSRRQPGDDSANALNRRQLRAE